MWLRCPQIDNHDIWGNVDSDESEALTAILLKKGQRSPAAAAMVRGAVDAADYIVVGSMVLPRVKETVEALRSSPLRNQPAIKVKLFRGREKKERAA